MPGEEIKNMCDAMEEDAQQKIIEGLENRIAKLIKERDEYNKRRREAMRSVEEWREKYHGVVGNPANRKTVQLTCSGNAQRTQVIALANDGSVWLLTVRENGWDERWIRMPTLPKEEK